MTKPTSTLGFGALPLLGGRVTTPGATVAVAVGFVATLGLLLRLHQLDAASLWSDEAFSGHWIHRSLDYMWTEGLVIETTPPLYYMLLKAWAAVAGDSDFSLRLFSAVASTATIPLVFLLGVEVAGVAAALTATLLFALAPMQIAYAQEARVYALVPLFFGIALLGLLRFVRAAGAMPARKDDAGLALYGVGAVLLIYGHATSVFTVAALASCGGALLLARPARWALPRFLLVNAIVAVVSIPELYAILNQAGRHDLDWVHPPDAVALLNLMINLLIDPVTPLSHFRLSWTLACVTTILLGAAAAWLRPGRIVQVLLLAVPAVFLVAVIGVSFWSPFLIPRIVIWIGLPLSVVAGMALFGPAPRWLRGLLALALASCILIGMHGVYVRSLEEKEDWRGLMQSLLPHLGAEDMVVIGPSTSLLPMLRYSEGAFEGNGRQLFRWEPKPRAPDLYLPTGIATPIGVTSEMLAEQARNGRRIWLLMRKTDWALNGEAALAIDPPPKLDLSHPSLVEAQW